eukprot:5282467-Amphidinium_carterae.1
MFDCKFTDHKSSPHRCQLQRNQSSGGWKRSKLCLKGSVTSWAMQAKVRIKCSAGTPHLDWPGAA